MFDHFSDCERLILVDSLKTSSLEFAISVVLLLWFLTLEEFDIFTIALSVVSAVIIALTINLEWAQILLTPEAWLIERNIL
jgi:hypothetical protein